MLPTFRFAILDGRARPRTVRAAAALAALLLAAACGPLAADDGVRVDYRDGATYSVPAGGTLYVAHVLQLDDVGLSVADVRQAGLRWIPLGIRGQSTSAATLVTVAPPEAPEGWEVRLWQARFVRERPLGDPEGAYAYRLEVDLRVDVPEEAYDLTRRVHVRVVARDGGATTLSFLVRAL